MDAGKYSIEKFQNDQKRSKQTLQMTKNAKKKDQNDQNY